MVRTHTFNGHKFDIRLYHPEKLNGLCESPIGEGPTLRIFTRLDTRKGLETIIHEAAHACFWAKTEEKVEQTARELARFLWRLGFRKVK